MNKKYKNVAQFVQGNRAFVAWTLLALILILSGPFVFSRSGVARTFGRVVCNWIVPFVYASCFAWWLGIKTAQEGGEE